MKAGGYSTYMSGKWHVTTIGGYDAPNGSYPVQRGFDRYYGCLHGGGSYYKPDPVYNNLDRITDLPDDYYYTKAITDSAVSFVHAHDTRKPMFLYVAHYAPHLPLQAPAEYVKSASTVIKSDMMSYASNDSKSKRASDWYPIVWNFRYSTKNLVANVRRGKT